VARALAEVQATVTVAGIESDRLYPLPLQEELARLLLETVPCRHQFAAGHDGFLLETEQVVRSWHRYWPTSTRQELMSYRQNKHRDDYDAK